LPMADVAPVAHVAAGCGLSCRALGRPW